MCSGERSLAIEENTRKLLCSEKKCKQRQNSRKYQYNKKPERQRSRQTGKMLNWGPESQKPKEERAFKVRKIHRVKTVGPGRMFSKLVIRRSSHHFSKKSLMTR